MAVKSLLLLAYLIVQVSCGQNSLTFVIDDTGSMYNEIFQVKKAAKSIVDIVLKEKSSQIQDIVLVTFNDPGTVVRKKTRNENELKEALDSIYVHGGGDCEEVALAGIKTGLEQSLPGSYVFVFTDASAKDFGRFAEIKTLCQEKQSQIVFILTGDCNDVSKETYQVYHKIAAASHGQVFRIDKDEVGQVLEYVKETIKGDRTVIESVIVPAHTWKDILFNIDEQTQYAIVSASGSKVVLHVYNPETNEIAGKHITWTDNVKVTKLTNLARGTYRVRVKGNSEVNIMIFGRTDYTFQHGFSTTVETNLKATDTQPTTGVETHLMVSVQDKTHTAVIREVELLDMRDRVIRRLPLARVEGDVYKTEKFLSPEGTFKIVVSATSKTTGDTVKRTARTPVTPIQSVPPAISKTEAVLKVKEGAPIDIHCRIVGGKPWPQISWYVKKQGATEFSPLKDTTDVYRVAKALTDDQYKCVAKNVRGRDEHVVRLNVQMRPVFRKSSDTIITNEGEPATIMCKLQKGNPHPKVTWYFKRRDTADFKEVTHDGELWDIPATQLSKSGVYKCVAKNSEGQDEKITTLVVKAKPTLEKLHPKLTAMENTTHTLFCRVISGFPKPTVNWFYKGPHSDEYKLISKNIDGVHSENVQMSNAGHYKCVAENEMGQTEQVVELIVNAPPRILFFPPNTPEYIGVQGDVAMRLPCAAVGHPTPVITWEVDKQVVGNDKSKQLYVENNALFLLHPKITHSSDNSHAYFCRAKNEFGEATQPYEVYISEYIDSGDAIGTIYAFLERPYDLVCPLPYKDPNSVRWYKNSTNVNTTGPSLHFTYPTDGDSGNYTCRVSDLTGAASHSTELIFGNPPEQDESSFNIKWQTSEEKRMACYSDETPHGKYEWSYNGKKIDSAHQESLLITGWGQYTCHITHPLRNLSLSYNVTPSVKECGIPTSFLKTEHVPLILDSKLAWPTLTTFTQNFIMRSSDNLQLTCQDESNSSSNSFTKFPALKSIYATCDSGYSFFIDGVPHKIFELDCKDSVTSSIHKTGKQCLGENTELMRVGFYINGFTVVYESCVDTVKNVPLYTKMNTIAVKKESSETVEAIKSACINGCCYEKIQLVNAADVSLGPAEKATFIDKLNSVNYCKPKNNTYTTWHDIENLIRERADEEKFTVWSGATNYVKIGGTWTPKYLWKVIKSRGKSENIMVVIHENMGIAEAKLCAGTCGEEDVWLEPAGERTYCCSLGDFKKALNVALDFNEG